MTGVDLLALVRAAGQDDLDAIAGLEEAAFHDPWPREMLAYELCNPCSVLLIAGGLPGGKGGGLPGAYAAFRHAVGEAELLRVAVHPGARRQGLARALLLAGFERLRQAGVQVCFLEVRVENKPAIALYESLGFSWVGLRRAYYQDGADAIVFVLEL